ncbi:hypothetical protein HOLleu_36616 [Holothuria leucospilota]|uniref:Uncharacterized protein n=1 Tax=Holothuria leucospilota TaxID=206669 RepID=A0A9Q0YMF1_HOLLE|nr:hypothetical protein HOLleu_36616 [Holothuria leucospilota]
MIPHCFWWRSKVIWGHQRSKCCKHYLMKSNYCPYLVDDPYYFWWRSKVMWGHQRSKVENHVNTTSQEG